MDERAAAGRGPIVITAVVFDFDGVLVESLDVKAEAFRRLFEAEGEEVGRQVVQYHLDHGGISRFDKFRHIYAHILKRDLDEAQFERLCSGFAALVTDRVVGAAFVPGAREFLDHYAASLLLFVVSATPEGELKEIVGRRGMDRYFRRLYGAPLAKADALRLILSEEALRPEDVLYVGDARSDYEAARATGVQFVGRVAGTPSPLDGMECRKIGDLYGLPALLEEEPL